MSLRCVGGLCGAWWCCIHGNCSQQGCLMSSHRAGLWLNCSRRMASSNFTQWFSIRLPYSYSSYSIYIPGLILGGALLFSLICVSINGWVNNRKAGDLRCYHAHYDVTIMNSCVFVYSDADQRKHQTPRVTGLCAGNSPGTGEFPGQMASNAENVSIWWRHHVSMIQYHLCGQHVIRNDHKNPPSKSPLVQSVITLLVDMVIVYCAEIKYIYFIRYVTGVACIPDVQLMVV